MRGIIIFLIICIAGLYTVTGFTENSAPKNLSEVIAAKRKVCYFLNDSEFENIVDKPCIVYKAGGPLWSMIVRNSDTFGIRYFDDDELQNKSRSREWAFDTTVFFEKYSSFIDWALYELPDIISKEKVKKREMAGFHLPSVTVFSKDSIYNIPLWDYEYEHKDVKSKVNDLLFMMFRLTESDKDKKYHLID